VPCKVYTVRPLEITQKVSGRWSIMENDDELNEH